MSMVEITVMIHFLHWRTILILRLCACFMMRLTTLQAVAVSFESNRDLLQRCSVGCTN